jgi:hypothetical protein
MFPACRAPGPVDARQRDQGLDSPSPEGATAHSGAAFRPSRTSAASLGNAPLGGRGSPVVNRRGFTPCSAPLLFSRPRSARGTLRAEPESIDGRSTRPQDDWIAAVPRGRLDSEVTPAPPRVRGRTSGRDGQIEDNAVQEAFSGHFRTSCRLAAQAPGTGRRRPVGACAARGRSCSPAVAAGCDGPLPGHCGHSRRAAARPGRAVGTGRTTAPNVHNELEFRRTGPPRRNVG